LIGCSAMQRVCWWLLFFFALPVFGAEKMIDFSGFGEGETPKGFRSAVGGSGKPGDWKIVLDEVPSALQTSSSQGNVTRKAVLAQLSQDKTDEHFPVLIYEGEVFDDFTLTTKVKPVRGSVEQMGGIVFRAQNETNYYVVRASALGSTFKFYKVANGERGVPVGVDIPVASNAWHDLKIECKGDEIRCSLDGKEYISLRDKANPLLSGKIGFWTKSDSVSYFWDTKLVYKPHIPPAQALVEETLSTYSKVLDLKLSVLDGEKQKAVVIASKDAKNLGQATSESDLDTLRKGTVFYGKENEAVIVVMPVRDRNGDPIAAARVLLKSFPGQTEQNALARATPVVKAIQARVQTLEDLVD
jgi:Domain of Unknown Function (DUF1080)